jgi:hypothetical protein
MVGSMVPLFAVFTPARGPASKENERFAPEVCGIKSDRRLQTEEYG